MAWSLVLEAVISNSEICKVEFASQSPTIARCGTCQTNQNFGFGGWARGKYEPTALSLPVFRPTPVGWFVVVGFRKDVKKRIKISVNTLPK